MTKANSTLESDPAVLSTLVTKILVLLALLPRCMEGVSLGANGADSSFCHRGSEQKSAGDQRSQETVIDGQTQEQVEGKGHPALYSLLPFSGGQWTPCKPVHHGEWNDLP
ncbi:uncharacterized protein LOC301230 isoform X1 [Rattus norvegicus]|uniref:uncharacterized protein LOC301230 isoform X1 n=1 Tax=Rattus norvegicus TaxID=10116 RepID=UPI002FD7EF02